MTIRRFVLLFLFVFSMTSLVFADDVLSSSDNVELKDIEIISNDLQLENVSLSVQRVSASDSNGFKAVLLSLLGDYETVVTDYTYSSGNGYTSHSISIERDWSWICSCCILGLVVYCVFRLVGSLWSRF